MLIAERPSNDEHLPGCTQIVGLRDTLNWRNVLTCQAGARGSEGTLCWQAGRASSYKHELCGRGTQGGAMEVSYDPACFFIFWNLFFLHPLLGKKQILALILLKHHRSTTFHSTAFLKAWKSLINYFSSFSLKCFPLLCPFDVYVSLL